MKVGDLVRCSFQPRVEKIINHRAFPMKYEIKGEFGVIRRQSKDQNLVLFPKFGYTHWLANSTLEVIDESR